MGIIGFLHQLEERGAWSLQQLEGHISLQGYVLNSDLREKEERKISDIPFLSHQFQLSYVFSWVSVCLKDRRALPLKFAFFHNPRASSAEVLINSKLPQGKEVLGDKARSQGLNEM